MNNAATLLKIATLLTIALLATGCNTMKASMDSIKYGQLYTMQEALEQAAADCSNQDALNRASNWAVIGHNDLQNSKKHMDKRSVQYAETRHMMRTLSTFTARHIDTKTLCKNITVAAKQGKHYLSQLEDDSLITEQPVVLAFVQY